MAHLTKCPACGLKKFGVLESYVWRAHVNDDGELYCADATSYIDEIACSDCHAIYEYADFSTLTFD